MSKQNIIIVDTNIFIHFLPLKDWAWDTDVTPPIRLIICDEVIKELDIIKDREHDGKKTRARDAQKIVSAIDENNGSILLRDNVTIECYDDSYKCSEINENLDPTIPDDKIIAVGLIFKEKYPDSNVYFLSNDLSPRRRAKKLGILAIQPPEKYKVNSDKNNEKEIAISKQEGLPYLDISFNILETTTSKPLQRLNIRPIGVSEERPEHPSTYDSRQPLKRMSEQDKMMHRALSMHLGLGFISDSSIESYNKKLENFKNSYRKYYEDWIKYESTMNEIYKIKIFICNTGKKPAEKPQLILSLDKKFDDYWALITEDDVPLEPEKGELVLPELPKLGESHLLNRFNIATPIFKNLISNLPSIYPPHIFKDDDGKIICNTESCIRQESYVFEHFYILRKDKNKKGVKLDFSIKANNINGVKKGSLNLIIDADDASRKEDI